MIWRLDTKLHPEITGTGNPNNILLGVSFFFLRLVLDLDDATFNGLRKTRVVFSLQTVKIDPIVALPGSGGSTEGTYNGVYY